MTSPPPFAWDDWYALVGGRSIRIEEVDDILHKIYDDQYQRFDGDVAADPRRVRRRPPRPHVISRRKPPNSAPTSSASARSSRADVYRGRVVTEKYAIAVGQRMRWREFQVVPSRESAIECLRVYYTLGETVIQLASYLRSIGYACKIEHPIGDSDLLHIPIGLKAGFGELGRHGSIIHPTLGPLFRMGSVATSMRARHRPSDRRRHRASSATPAARAGSSARRTRFLTNAAPRPARIISATTATSWTPVAAFRISRSTRTAPSACRSAPTTTRSGRRTSTGFRRSSFRKSSCPRPPRRSIRRTSTPRMLYVRIHRP